MNNKDHLMKIIDVLYNECISAGGDGDALWYSRYYSINDIKTLVEEYNSKLKFPFEISDISDDTFSWGENQEWIIITTNEGVYDLAPEWISFKLKN